MKCFSFAAMGSNVCAVYATTVVWAILELKSQTVAEGELYVLQKAL